jgi:hypothetical protein
MSGSASIALDGITAPLRFSNTLEAAIKEVLPAQDSFDDADFDPTAHINKLFPTEDSLAGVEPHMAELQEQMKSMDEEILQTVRMQTSAGSSARRDLEQGKQSVQELFLKVRDIKAKADASEQMVHEICRDIKSLDFAKRHLTQTITALKRLQMLVTAVEQLDVMARERMYAEAANLLQAVNQLLVHFDTYVGIQKIDDLREQIGTIRTALRTQVFEDFNQLSADNSTVAPQHAQFETLVGACAVVDALGYECRKEMVAWFSGWQFAPYKHMFQPYGEAGTLDKTELRYAWHRQLLKTYDSSFANLFPPSWRVAHAITCDFCTISQKHLEEILDQSRGSLDVAVLTHALQKTTEFEVEMHNRFRIDAMASSPPDVSDEAGGPSAADPTKSGAEPTLPPIIKLISSAFDSYMGIYVSLEDKALDDMSTKMLASENWVVTPSGRADSRVFDSSKELFINLRRSFKRATPLHMSHVLCDLHKVWGRHLKAYAKKVLEQLPNVKQPADPSLPPECNIDIVMQNRVCAVVNTCEYCHETTGQLEESIIKSITEETFKEQVDLSPVQEEFHNVVTAGMKVLVAALESRAAPYLKQMCKVSWTEIDEIGEDTSPYMQELVAQTRDLMPQLGESLHPLYVRFFCDKFVASFVPRLIGNIYRCRRIGEVGAQQMQLDVGTLKQTLLDLPTLGQANATNAYTKLVASEVHKAEQLLKLVQTPEELLETTVEEMSKEKDAGVIDLQRILELKGLKKDVQDRMLDSMKDAMSATTESSKKLKKMLNLGGS